VTVREETERVETVAGGCNGRVGADTDASLDALGTPVDPGERGHPYGDGNAAERIVEVIADE
jgi:UDP-N-acetylglucosamine 2-epimerase